MATTIYIDNGCRCTDPSCGEEHAQIAVYFLSHPDDEGGNTHYATLADLMADLTDTSCPQHEAGEGKVTDLRTGQEWDAAEFREANR